MVREALKGTEERIVKVKAIPGTELRLTEKLERMEARQNQPSVSLPEPKINLPNRQAEVFGRDREAKLLLDALQVGPAAIEVVAPPGFGKSALLARTLAIAMPGAK